MITKFTANSNEIKYSNKYIDSCYEQRLWIGMRNKHWTYWKKRIIIGKTTSQ